MPKKVPLQDHSGAHFGYRREYFSEKISDGLAQRFGFRSDFDLHKALNDAAEWWDMFRKPGDSPPSVRRKALETVRQQAEDLWGSIRRLGHHSRVDLWLHAPPVRPKPDLEKLTIDLQVLQWAARNALKALPSGKSGRRRNEGERLFVAGVRQAYVEGTGKTDKETYSDLEGSYRGNFFEFLRECLKVMGIRKSDSRIAAMAREVASGEEPDSPPIEPLDPAESETQK